MRYLYIYFLVLSQFSHAQIKPEIIEVKRLMSVGEKSGFKLLLLDQEINKVEKLTKEVMKSLNAEQVKSQKNNRELIFKKLYLAKEDKPIYLFSDIIQEGKNIGFYAYFLFEKDSSAFNNTEAIKETLTSIHNKIIYSVYDDSIFFQQKILKEANSNLSDRIKEKEKNQKKINQAKDDINSTEMYIEKSKKEILALNESLPDLEKNSKEKEGEFKAADKNLDKTKRTEDVIDDAKSKLKKMTKNLSELQKEPSINEHLIIALQQDISILTISIQDEELKYKQALEHSKSEYKLAEKNCDNAKDNIKDVKKSIKNLEENIVDATKKIGKLRVKIDDLYGLIDTFVSKDKEVLEEEIKKQELILNELNKTQILYK